MVESLRSVILKSAEYIYSMFISFFFGLTGRFIAGGWAEH